MAENSAELRHATAAVIAVLTGGWALLNAGLPSTEDLAAGQTMTIGSGDGYEASVTFDENWKVVTGSSTLDRSYLFTKGPVDLLVSVVEPPEPATADELWDGMRDIVRVGDASASLGEPKPTTSESGAEGLTGDLHSQEHSGIAAVFPSPNGVFAVEAQTGGADAGPTDITDVEELIDSIRFGRAPGGTA
jgi:hypothetical protein